MRTESGHSFCSRLDANALAETNGRWPGGARGKTISRKNILPPDCREVWNICTCRRPTCKTMRSAPPVTTAYQYAVFFRPSNIHLRESEFNFQTNSLLLPHFFTKDCIIHHNLLWRLILIRPFLKKGGALIIWMERTYSPPASNGNLPGYE